MSANGIKGVQRFDHVGVVVEDLQLVTAFFEDLGFEHGDPIQLEGEWMDRVVGLDRVQAEMVIVNAPDGSGRLELTKYHRPAHQARAHQPSANRLGFRHIAYVVEDLDSVVNRLRGKGLNTIGDIVNYENTYRLCYIGGPEGLIVELVEQIQTDSDHAT
jgi:catechol 2,3-dioxygenase-like lactoylglutathione lyase family enzyme